MDRMTLREAAQRTSRSITTLRRYIRSGRLHAEKRDGRFGPEYFVSEGDLVEAGLQPRSTTESSALTVREGGDSVSSPVPATTTRDAVPLVLFQDLQMKHEQLLVQYGMIRAGGLRVMELQAEVETTHKDLERSRARVVELREQFQQVSNESDQQMREARLELEGRALEIAALREKVRGLEMLHRNAATTESIEKQFSRVVEQSRRVENLGPDRPKRSWRLGQKRSWPGTPDHEPPEH